MKKCKTKFKTFQKIGTHKKSQKTSIISYKRGQWVCVYFLLNSNS